jgi:carbonic anhydrase/acetyltransferase-like protein (isoleucine patch superfamily)
MKNTVKQLDMFLRKTPKLGRGVYLAKTAVVLGDVTLGAHSSVWYGAVLRGDINRIVVGHHSNIQDNAVLHLADDFGCILGNWVTVGHGAIVHACTVGDEVLVGMGAVILDGAVIGRQSIIGAKALVTGGAKIRRAGEGRPQAVKGRTLQAEMVGATLRGQRSLLLETRNQRGRANVELTSARTRERNQSIRCVFAPSR